MSVLAIHDWPDGTARSGRRGSLPRATAGTGRVSWSGGEAARDAAAAWASSNGATTLEMTISGARIARIAPRLDWQGRARSLWIQASEKFASGAAGEVHVFQDSTGVSLQSIWSTVEYPALRSNPSVARIIYHVIMPDGEVIVVP